MEKIPICRISVVQEQSKDQENFRIRDVQTLLAGRDLSHGLHKHDFFFILLLEEGTGMHEIDFISYPIQDKSVFCIRPGQVHKLELKSDGKGYLLEFDKKFYNPQDNVSFQRFKRGEGKKFCKMEEDKFAKLHSIMRYIFHEYATQQEGYTNVIKANLEILFIEFLRQCQAKDQSDAVNAYALKRFEEFTTLLEKRSTELRQVSEYAGVLNLSLYQLNAVTKEVAGKTASEVMNEHIILEAKRLLLATSFQVKDVAYHLGYEDDSYFIRFFKKHTGSTPELFKRNFK